MNPSFFAGLEYLLRFFTTVSIVLLIASCTENPQTSTQTADVSANQAPSQNAIENIALVMKTLTNPFFVEMERGARRAEKELGINLLVKTATQETSIQQQIGIVESLIKEKVDAIVIAPGDSIELIPVLKQAQEAGIVVINIDNQLDENYSIQVGLKDVPFISVDNSQAAYESVKALTTRINSPTKVGILEGIREAKNANDRKEGAVKAFNENAHTEIVAMETAHWKIDEGFEVTKKMLDEHPEIGALFCANDMMALGAIKYLKSSGRNDVIVAAYDALKDAIEAVKDGSLIATVDQQPAEQGYKGVVYAHLALAGEKLPSTTLIDTMVITRENCCN